MRFALDVVFLDDEGRTLREMAAFPISLRLLPWRRSGAGAAGGRIRDHIAGTALGHQQGETT
jgi:hypothetical protein